MIRTTRRPASPKSNPSPAATAASDALKPALDGKEVFSVAPVVAANNPLDALIAKAVPTRSNASEEISFRAVPPHPRSHDVVTATLTQNNASARLLPSDVDRIAKFFNELGSSPKSIDLTGDLWQGKDGLICALGDIVAGMKNKTWPAFGRWLTQIAHLATKQPLFASTDPNTERGDLVMLIVCAAKRLSHASTRDFTFLAAASIDIMGCRSISFDLTDRCFTLHPPSYDRVMAPVPIASFIDALVIAPKMHFDILNFQELTSLVSIIYDNFGNMDGAAEYAGLSGEDARLLTFVKLLDHFAKNDYYELAAMLNPLCLQIQSDLENHAHRETLTIRGETLPHGYLRQMCKRLLAYDHVTSANDRHIFRFSSFSIACDAIDSEIYATRQLHIGSSALQASTRTAPALYSGQTLALAYSELVTVSNDEDTRLSQAYAFVDMCKNCLDDVRQILAAISSSREVFNIRGADRQAALLHYMLDRHIPVSDLLGKMNLLSKEQEGFYHLQSIILMPSMYFWHNFNCAQPQELSRRVLRMLMDYDIHKIWSDERIVALCEDFQLTLAESAATWATLNNTNIFALMSARVDTFDLLSKISYFSKEDRATADATCRALMADLKLTSAFWAAHALAIEGIAENHQHKGATVAMMALGIGLRVQLDDEQLAWVEGSGLLQALMHLPAPHLRPMVAAGIAALATDPTQRQRYGARVPLRLERKSAAAVLLGGVMCQLESIAVTTDGLRKALDGQGYRIYKDGTKIIALLEALQSLTNHPNLHETGKPQLAALLLADIDTAIALLAGRANKLMTIMREADAAWLDMPNISLDQLANLALKKCLGDVEVPDIAARFATTFGASRAPFAVAEYMANLGTLREPSLDAAVRLYVSDVLQQRFEQERMNPANNPHLGLLEQQKPGILALWGAGSVTYTSPRKAVPAWDAKVWLQECLINFGHLPGAASHMPDLVSQLGFMRRDASPRARAERDEPQLPSAVAPLTWANISAACVALLRSKPKDQIMSLERLRLCLDGLGADCEFAHDISSQRQTLEKQAGAAAKGTSSLIDTADPIHLLLCGTDVVGSCQRITGDATLNRGLLGYLLNGQTRLLAVVKEDTQTLQARCVLRLLTDGQTPVLFLERLYGDPAYADALLTLAAHKAKTLGIQLTQYSAQASRKRPSTSLFSVGGRSPVEYCDGATGVCEGSQYQIRDAEFVSLEAR